MLSAYVPATQGHFVFPVIHSLGVEAAGSTRYSQSGGTPASVAWPAANRAIYIPFQISETMVFTRVHWYNGATAAGNVDVGIYSENGTRLGSTGAIAQGTINVVQTNVLTANTTCLPGRYFMAMLCSSGTATVFAQAASLSAKMAGLYQQSVGAGALPATATFATWTSQIHPVFSLSTLGA